MFVYNQNNTPGVDPLNLPRVASNLFTRYETWTKLTDPSGKVY